MEKNYEAINTTVSFSVLCYFRSVGYLLHIVTHERMHLLPVNTKGGTQNTCPVLCSLVVYIFLVILFSPSVVILTISNYF